MFHIKYNARRGSYTWNEIRCLCRCLGFQPDLISVNLPREFEHADPDELSIKEFMRLINLKYLDLAVDKTFNAHTADWNLCVFKKALLLIDNRILSFEELNDIRVSYSMYEHQDLKGLELSEKTLLRCLKILSQEKYFEMCGRLIAPLKMQNRIKHMSQTFDEEGRIQLYEFLDLILWTELIDDHKPKQPYITHTKQEGDDCYKIEDFQHIIKHYDERLAEYLNELYMNEEWSFTKEGFSNQKLPNELPVNRDFRLGRMREGQKHYNNLKQEVGASQKSLHLTATGHIRPRPLTAPNLDRYDYVDKSSIYTALSQRPLTVTELVKDYVNSPSRAYNSASAPSKNVEDLESRPPTRVKPAVTDRDVERQDRNIQDLKFKMNTLENKHIVQLEKKIKEELPHYVKQPPENKEPSVVPPQKKINPALTPEHINRLAYAPYRPIPNSSHAAKCDARFRGWHKTKTTKGKHYILTTNTFSSHPISKNFEKIQKKSASQVRRVKGEIVVRQTESDNVKPDVLRPATAPDIMQRHSASIETPVSDAEDPSEQGQQKTIRYDPSLETINEGSESRVMSSKSRITSGQLPAAVRDVSSAATSSGGSAYSYHDFKMFEDYIDKPGEIRNQESAAYIKDDVPAPITSSHEPNLSDVRRPNMRLESRNHILRPRRSVSASSDSRLSKSRSEKMMEMANRRHLPPGFKRIIANVMESSVEHTVPLRC